MQSTFKEQRLRWFGHVHRQTIYWTLGIGGERVDVVKVGSYHILLRI